MKLTDTLSGQLVDLESVCTDRQVSFYSCGPTVYDYPHLGNWYTFLRWDLLVRTLEAQAWRVKWVMNITDVGHLASDADDGEDKLVARAQQLGQTAWEVARFYGDYFDQALERLNFRQPDHLPKATDCIEEQIELVRQLEERGLTYQIADGVYFDTQRWPDYGRLGRSDPTVDGQARIEPNPDKRSAADFALWKLTPPGIKRDMEWSSPWGSGWPGWHIECSAMCRRYLGETVTIHAGGVDHIPIHHTNEMAQLEPITGQPLARIWLHSNFILVEGQKMSKSAGNFTTLEEIESGGYSLAELRLAVAAANYRTQASFSVQLLESARRRYGDCLALSALRYQLVAASSPDSPDDSVCDQLCGQLLEALNEDLNSPRALSLLDEFFNQYLDSPWPASIEASLDRLLQLIEQIFGIKLMNPVANLTAEQQSILKRRQDARQAGDYQTADACREELVGQGLAIRDLPDNRQHWAPLPNQ